MVYRMYNNIEFRLVRLSRQTNMYQLVAYFNRTIKARIYFNVQYLKVTDNIKDEYISR